MVDRPATASTLCTVSSGQPFATSLLPTAVGNATKVFDVDSSLTDTAISGAYIDEIFLRYSKKVNKFTVPQDAAPGTFAVVGSSVTVCTITTTSPHNLQAGQKAHIVFSGHTGGLSVPVTNTYEVQDTANLSDTTFDITIPSQNATTGTVAVSLPVDFCFYLVNTGVVTNTAQFFPLFVASVDSSQQSYSLTEEKVLPFINHPTVQAGANFGSANNTLAPKQRGLMLKRGQALYVAASGATALAAGFYCNVQGGFY